MKGILWVIVGTQRKESSFKLRRGSLQAKWGDGGGGTPGRGYCILEPGVEPTRGLVGHAHGPEKWGGDHCAGKHSKEPARARMQMWREYKSGKTELLVCVLFRSHQEAARTQTLTSNYPDFSVSKLSQSTISDTNAEDIRKINDGTCERLHRKPKRSSNMNCAPSKNFK